MPKVFTPAQLAASASLGELRTQQSFAGDTDAWHAYQEHVYSTLQPGEALPPVHEDERAKLWKAAQRQRGKIEKQRSKNADADAEHQPSKKLKVSTLWQDKHVAGVVDVQLGSPRAVEGGRQALRQLRATVTSPGGVNTRECCEDVCYDLPPAEGESDKEARLRADRNRRREQLALERLAKRPEQELAAQHAAQLEAEQAETRRLAEEEARRVRMAAVVRDGNTLYVHGTFVRLAPSSFTPFDTRDVRVYYPDGSSCNVQTPHTRPYQVHDQVMPWTRRRAVLPPTPSESASLKDLEHISTALSSMSSKVHCSLCTEWRDQFMEQAVCRASDCPYGNDCITYAPRRVPTTSELQSLGINWGGLIAFEPAHIPVGGRASIAHWRNRPPTRVLAAVAAAALPDGPRPRTEFTHVAAKLGLPGSLQYMQVGDVVLWKQVPHFVNKIGAITYGDENEILFRSAEQQGRNSGIANGRDPAFLSRVAKELEPPRAEDVEWAQAVAAAAKAGTPTEALPPPPPQPPAWRHRSVQKPSHPLEWNWAVKEAGLPPCFLTLREADVVTWRGTSYFATAPHAEDAIGVWQNDLELYILTPEQFVQFSLSRKPGQRFTGFGRRHIADLGEAVKLELMPKQLPEITITPRDSAWWSEEVAEREDAQREEVRQLVARRAEQLQALSQLTMADEAVAEAARTTADAAVSAYEQREAAWQAYATAFAAQYSGSYGPAEPAAPTAIATQVPTVIDRGGDAAADDDDGEDSEDDEDDADGDDDVPFSFV